MRLPKEQLEPIMTKGDMVANVGSNAYAKAATGLNILRETVMGRELFDYAFKEYARRWAFKHPTPADFFRTMEDASGVDLDWFWRGWYFGTDAVDISIDSVKWYKMDDASNTNAFRQQPFEPISKVRNRNSKETTYATDVDTSLRDFYYYNPGTDAAFNLEKTARESASLVDLENRPKWVNKNFYELTFSNLGGMLMPLVIEWTYKDGSKEVERIPVTIWRLNEKQVTKVFVKDKEVSAVRLDPFRETADINEANQVWPLKEIPNRFQLFKQAQVNRFQSSGGNSMQRAQK
jgi:hypothetical protein